METDRRKDIESELIKLGWTNEEWNCNELQVFQEYRPNKKHHPELPWEFIVFCKTPVWEWDFVEYHGYYANTKTGVRDGLSYKDYNPKQGVWIHNERLDFEFADNTDAKKIASVMDQQRTEENQSEVFRYEMLPWKVAVQRVVDRPTKEQLNG